MRSKLNLRDSLEALADLLGKLVRQKRLATELPEVKGVLRIEVEEGSRRWIHWEGPNCVTHRGREAIAKILTEGDVNWRLKEFRFGTGLHEGTLNDPGDPSACDQGLEDQKFTKDIAEYVYQELVACGEENIPTAVEYKVVMEYEEANGYAYTEAGLFCSNGVMFAVETFPQVVKNSDRRITWYWKIQY